MENRLFKILTNLSKIPEQLNYMTKCVLTSIAFFRNVNAAFGKDVTHNTAFHTAQEMLKNFSFFCAV